jgi:FkbH-like protein
MERKINIDYVLDVIKTSSVDSQQLATLLRNLKLKTPDILRLGRALREITTENSESIKVAVISTRTPEFIVNAISVALAHEGLLSSFYVCPYGSAVQEIMAPNSRLYEFKADIIYLDLGPEVLNLPSAGAISKEEIEKNIDENVDFISELWEVISTRSSAAIIHQTFVEPLESFTGFAEKSIYWTQSNIIQSINRALTSRDNTRILFLDADRISKLVGLRNWHDPRLWFYGRFGFSPTVLPEYVMHLSAVIRLALSQRPKALILDCDNTLWGGVIGDDGLSGIRLGPDSPEGEAFQAFCRYLVELSKRGIILGLCSKNNIENVREVFLHHRYMPLKLENFSVYRCNWNDKASNLREIAIELNIDLSAVVFVDDNPAECELVRKEVPEVRVLQLPADPSDFVNRVDDSYFFYQQRLTQEDYTRSASYRARKNLVDISRTSTDLESYLSSLSMTAKISVASESDVERLAQMESKTNQFNSTTRRLDVSYFRKEMNNTKNNVYTVRLTDKFGDHGLVSYVRAEQKGESLVVTDWLMSCRVFSRTLEHLVFNFLFETARGSSCNALEFLYRESKKNSVVRDALGGFGSCSMSERSDYTVFSFAITGHEKPLRSHVQLTSS